MRIVVITPHFAPDVAPTGDIVTRLVAELAERGHRIEVMTALPWYRDHAIAPGFGGRLVRREDTPWGRIVRLHPFPADKRSIARRALAFAGFSTLAGWHAARGEPADVVLALSPPLTLGAAGWIAARSRKAAFVFNVQDIFPDIAVELEAISNPRVVAAAHVLERFCYARADAVTALSSDLAANITSKVASANVHVIPNFVDTDVIKPGRKDNEYRREFGLRNKTVVMYAGNVGLSQPLRMMIDAAAALAHESKLIFVINGSGAALADLKARASGLPNVVFVDAQPPSRLAEVLAAADVHLVPLKPGLGRMSVPSKTYSVLAAGRPLIASVDPGTEIARIVEDAGAGRAIPPDDTESFVKQLGTLLAAPDEWRAMGRAGRAWVTGHATPKAIAGMYEELFESLLDNRRR